MWCKNLSPNLVLSHPIIPTPSGTTRSINYSYKPQKVFYAHTNINLFSSFILFLQKHRTWFPLFWNLSLSTKRNPSVHSHEFIMSFLCCYAFVPLVLKMCLFLRVLSHPTVRMVHCWFMRSLPWVLKVFWTKLSVLSSKTYCLGSRF